MNIEELRNYCIRKPEVTEGFPFDSETLVFKVAGKMFLLVSLMNRLCASTSNAIRSWRSSCGKNTLACDPDFT